MPGSRLKAHERPLYFNDNDPFQYDNVRSRAIDLGSRQMYESLNKPPPSSRSELSTHRTTISDECMIRRIDRRMAGYSGFVPGLHSESVSKVSFGRSVELANSMRMWS